MDSVKFFFDNKIQEIDFSMISPTTTVLDFLRSYPGRFGTKEGCAEGDCGSCTVVIAQSCGDHLEYHAVNSCMVFLPSLHGKFLITVEDLNQGPVLHPIQKVFIENFASQCGYCTPGFEMSLFALYKENPEPTDEEIIEAIEGNLCRCTGYRPIRDAAASLRGVIERDHISEKEEFVLEQLAKIEPKELLDLQHKDQRYLIPFSLDKALDLISKYPEAVIVNGSTDVALRRNKLKEKIKLVIDLSFIPELKYLNLDKDKIIIGAGVTVQRLKRFAKDNLPDLYEYLRVFAAKQIRNRATVGGNIMTASPIGDLIPALVALQAHVIIAGPQTQTYSLEDFIIGYRKTRLGQGQLLKQIIVPVNKDWTYRFYKVSKRTSLDISTVSLSAGILVNNAVIQDVRLVFGGMAEMVKRAKQAEDYLRGKPIKEEHFVQAGYLAAKQFSPISDARSSAEARSVLAKNLIVKFYTDLNKNTEK